MWHTLKKDEVLKSLGTNEITGLTNLSIPGYTLSPEFSNDIYEYTLNLTDDISELDIQTGTSSESIEVEVVGNENLKEGENVITILVRDTSEKDEDTATTTYQIIVNKSLSSNIDVTEVNDLITQAQNNINKQKWIIGGTIVIIVILIIIFLIERYRIQKNQSEDEEEIENIENLEYKQEREEENLEEVHVRRGSKKGKRFK